MLQQGGAHDLGRVETSHARRWPCLAAWRFAVPIPQREPFLSSDTNSSSRTAVAAELPFELAYRAVLSAELGRALCCHCSSPSDDVESTESFSTLYHPTEVQREVGSAERRRARFLPAIRFTSLLVLGLRRIRIEYAKRISAWRACASVSVPGAPSPMVPPGVPRVDSALTLWLQSSSGVACVRELRWLLPSISVLESRLRREVVGFRSLSISLLLAIQSAGVPLLCDGAPSWGPEFPCWDEARSVLGTRCSCSSPERPAPPLELCAQCGCARLVAACDPASALRCVWCRQPHGEPAGHLVYCLAHRTEWRWW